MHDLQHIKEIIASFDTAMLVTRDGDGMRARPMAIAPTKETDRIAFVTSIASDKVGELVDEPNVAVTMQSPSAYLSLSGRARVSSDKSRLEEIWHPAMDVWFEDGLKDPSAAIIDIDLDAAEFWEMSPMNKIRAAFEFARARLGDDTVQTRELGEHARVIM